MSKLHATVLAGLIALSISACSPLSKIDGEPAEVTFTDSTATKNIHKYMPSEIRTFNGSKSSPETEVSGIPCSVTGTGYHTEVITPAKIKLPTYLGKTDPIAVTCGPRGSRVTRNVAAINLTEQSYQNANVQAGSVAEALVGALAAGAMASNRNRAKDQFYYGPIFIDMIKR